MASSEWVTVEELKNDQTLQGRSLPREDEAMQFILTAAMEWVEAHRPDINYYASWSVPMYIRLGTLRLAARWFVRRISPDGLVNLGDLGGGMIMPVDPDIQTQLGVLGGLS